MYGSQAVQQTIEDEKASGYNSFGGESIFNNPNSQKSRMEYVQNILDRLREGKGWGDYSASDIFGSKVKPALFENAEYQPIDYGQVQGKTIGDNAANLPAIESLVGSINDSLRGDSTLRIEQFAPGFLDNLKILTDSSRALSSGQLPYSDVLDIVSNRQELGNTLGTAGTFGNATLKDLGLSRLSAMQTGSEMMARIANLTESIDPIGQRSRPQDFTLLPSQTVPLKQQDTQFGASYDQMERILAQQSEQNANLLNAAADPAARGIFGAEFAAKTGTPMGGGSSAGGGTDWAGLIGSLYGGYRQSQQGGGGYNPYQVAGSGQRYNPDAGAGFGSSSSAVGGYDEMMF